MPASASQQNPSCPVVDVPSYAACALSVLEDAGHEAWLVGGFVRDALRGVPCADIDIACSAPWRQTQAAFEAAGYATHETGTVHGTLTVVIEGQAVEITTYRADGDYRDARHPSSVEFVSSIEEDLARRDFTINAMAYHPDRGLCDPYGGSDDLAQGIIRAVGNPEKRFAEDALRILRACRFAAQLGFSIDKATYFGMVTNKGLLSKVSVERTVHELDRLLLGDHAGTALVRYVDVIAAVLPELVAMKGFEQHTPYHIYDVLEHTAHVIDGVPAYRLARWAALFHDMGKPACFFFDHEGVGHFYGHAAVSVAIARGICSRLKLSPAFAGQVLTLVKYHDDVVAHSTRSVKRMLARLGGSTELFRALCDLKRGDARGQAPRCAERIAGADVLLEILAEVEAQGDAFSIKKLAISGRDVMELGVNEGPQVGTLLQQALDAVIDEEIPNDRDALLAFVHERMS